MLETGKLLFNNGTARENRLTKWSGIKFFDGESLPVDCEFASLIQAITVENLREEKKVWRPEETIEASRTFFSQGKINVIGSPQSGKGTILFGLSEMCDILGVGYVFISGHHQETSAKQLIDTFHQAEEKGIPIFYDSTDYLFLRSRMTGRDISAAVQKEKVSLVVPSMVSLRVPIAITSHDEDWAHEFVNRDLRSQYQRFLSCFPVYEIPLHLQSDASILRFLQDHKIDPEMSQCIIEMGKNQSIIDFLRVNLGQEKMMRIFSALRTYPVLKELVRERKDDLYTIMKEIENNGDIFLFANLILEIDEKCRNLTYLRKNKKVKRSHA